jgi:hypothetical protein
MATATNIRAKDIIRARRLGNRTIRRYVIDRVVQTNDEFDIVRVDAHAEHSGSRATRMAFDASTVRVVGNYR